MDFPATLVGPNGEETDVNDAATYNQLRDGDGWSPKATAPKSAPAAPTSSSTPAPPTPQGDASSS